MRLKHVRAVWLKQAFDIRHNYSVILQFVLFPLLSWGISLVIPWEMKPVAVMILSSNFTSIVPMVTVRNIIREDRSKGVLRAFIYANVSPTEYLMGINAFLLGVSLITSILIGSIFEFSGFVLLKYMLVLLLGTVTTLIVGSALTISSAIDSTGIAFVVFMLFNSMIPILGMFNSTAQTILRFTYPYQISNMIGDIYGGYFEINRVIVVFFNIMFFLAVFIILYKKEAKLKCI